MMAKDGDAKESVPSAPIPRRLESDVVPVYIYRTPLAHPFHHSTVLGLAFLSVYASDNLLCFPQSGLSVHPTPR